MPINCTICGHSTTFLKEHLETAHVMTLAQYQAAHPGATIASDQVLNHLVTSEIVGSGPLTRAHPPEPENLKIPFAGIEMPIHANVPAEACLQEPWQYQIPENGDLASDVAEAAIALASGKPLWIHGVPGSGKDALLQYFSARTRTPALFLQINPKTNLEAWFYRRGFSQDGSNYEEGNVLKALRDGYTTPSGERVPYMVVFSDFDRADPRQMEAIRACVESTGGRVPGPQGAFYPILEGTRICFTANSSGTGDEFGRRITSNPVDSAFMDRLSGIQFHWMDWADEEKVLRAKFPEFTRRAGTFLEKIGRVTAEIRMKIHDEELNIEFSHRALEKWLAHAEAILEHSSGSALPPKLINRSARIGFLDLMPDRATREQVVAIMQPHIPEAV